MKTSCFFLLSISFLLSSCQKSTEINTGCAPNCFEYFSIEFSVQLCDVSIDQTCQIDSSTTPIPSASIYLFETAEFRTHGNPIIANGVTNSSGIYTTGGLETGDYFIKIREPQNLEEKETVVRINPGTVSPIHETIFFVK